MGLVSLQIQNSNNADVLLDSGLNLFNIIVNLCSKLYYEYGLICVLYTLFHNSFGVKFNVER